MYRLGLVLTIAATGMGAACTYVAPRLTVLPTHDDDGDTAPVGGDQDPNAPHHIELIHGDGQSAVVSSPVPLMPRVRVLNAAGQPVAGASVHFYATAGGGTTTPVATVADAAGFAETEWVLGPSQGTGNNQLTAVAMGATGSPASVIITASGRPTPTLAVGPAFATNGAGWNQYVARDRNRPLDQQADAACNVPNAASYFDCLHGGELRRADIPGEESCLDLRATDALDAFDWTCAKISGGVRLLSTGLKPTRGLRTLVDATAVGFNLENLNVSRRGYPITASPLTLWWSNPVSSLDVGAGTITTLATDDAIWVAAPQTESLTQGLRIEADGVAIVTPDGTTLSYDGSATSSCATAGTEARAVVCSASKHRLWLEVSISGNAKSGSPATHGVALGHAALVRLHHTRVVGVQHPATAVPAAGIYGTYLTASLFTGTVAARSTDLSSPSTSAPGFQLLYSTGNTFLDCAAIGNAGAGLALQSGETNALLQRSLTADNAGQGLLFSSNPYEGSNVVTQLLAASNDGLNIEAYAEPVLTMQALTSVSSRSDCLMVENTTTAGSTFANLVHANSGDGIYMQEGQNNIFVDVVAAHDDHGLHLGDHASTTGTATDIIANEFRGDLLVGHNNTNCILETDTAGGANSLDTDCNHGTPPVAATTGVSLAASFVGPLDVVDPANGSVPFPANAGAVYNWIDFTTPWRTWGRDGVAPLDDDSTRGPCDATQCIINDWGLKVTDSVLRNAYGTPVAGQPCPSSVDASVGANVLTRTDSVGSVTAVWLRAAIELTGDLLRNPFGNDNGLCESHEGCLFTPNRGAYQGHGRLVPAGCTFVDGPTVIGVTLYVHEKNGYE